MPKSDHAGKTAEVADVAAELDMTQARPLTRDSSLADVRATPDDASALTYPDFTYRHYWGDFRGRVRLNLTSPVIRKTTNVFASISEANPIVSSTDPVPELFVGGADMAVMNIAPYNGGVVIMVSINWSTPLYTAVSYLFVNP